MLTSYLAITGRILLLAFERIIVRWLGDISGDRYKNTAATILFFGIGALFLAPFFIRSVPNSYSFIPYCYLASTVYSMGFVLYVLSLATGETSLVTPINSLNLFFLLVLAVIFLGESLGLVKIAGIVFMFSGISILKNISHPLQSIKYIFYDTPCRMMFASAFLISIGRVIDKSFTATVSPVVYSFFIYVFITMNLLIYLMLRKKIAAVKEVFVEKPLISISSGFVNAYSYLLLLYAMQRIELSIAEPLTQSSLLITLAFSAVFFKEGVREKLPGALLVVIGSYLLISNLGS